MRGKDTRNSAHLKIQRGPRRSILELAGHWHPTAEAADHICLWSPSGETEGVYQCYNAREMKWTMDCWRTGGLWRLALAIAQDFVSSELSPLNSHSLARLTQVTSERSDAIKSDWFTLGKSLKKDLSSPIQVF